jgi:glutamate:GABA antiporter
VSISPPLRRELRLADLVLFNVVAVLGVPWISSSAHIGPVAIPLHLIAAALFFVPCVFVVAALSRRFPEEGGFYVWTKHAFGPWHAFLCAWCWWISVLLYLPGLVLTAAGLTAGEQNPKLVLTLALALLWAIAAVNVVGLRIAKWVSNAAGTLISLGGGLIVIAAIAVFARDGAATTFFVHSGLGFDRLGLWAQIAFAYTGLELGSLLGGEVRDPARTIPRAAWISAIAVTGAYVVGTIALMLVMVPDDISPITGLADVAARAGERLGIAWAGRVATTLLLVGIIGKLSTWASGAARLPFVIGLDGALPEAFGRLHPRWGTPHIALIAQSAACSLFLVLTHAGETLKAGWQTLLDLAIVATFLPFIYIFLTGWKFGRRWSGVFGLFVTLTALALALVPPRDVSSVWLFELKVIGGCGLLVLIGWLAFTRSRTSLIR